MRWIGLSRRGSKHCFGGIIYVYFSSRPEVFRKKNKNQQNQGLFSKRASLSLLLRLTCLAWIVVQSTDTHISHSRIATYPGTESFSI